MAKKDKKSIPKTLTRNDKLMIAFIKETTEKVSVSEALKLGQDYATCVAGAKVLIEMIERLELNK